MSGAVFRYETQEISAPRVGLIALQADETIEGDMRRLMPDGTELMVTRIASDEEVSSDTLAGMEGRLTQAASLFPRGVTFDVVGYGCTSATAEIGADRIAEKIRAGAAADAVTQPLSALVGACEALGLKKLALLSPYVEDVSNKLRMALAERGVETPVFGSFNVGTEAVVVRITLSSIIEAAQNLVSQSDVSVDGLFLSCTNLRALDAIEPLEDALGIPVLASNQVLAWDMLRHAKLRPTQRAPGKLFDKTR